MFIRTKLPWFLLVFLSPPTRAIEIDNKTDAFDLNYINYGDHFEDHGYFTDTTHATEINPTKGYEVILKWMKICNDADRLRWKFSCLCDSI